MSDLPRLTRSERRMLGFLREHMLANDGIAPSYSEIAAGLDLRSRGRVSDVIANLAAKGVLRRTPHTARTIELLEPVGYFVPLSAEMLKAVDEIAVQVGVGPTLLIVEMIRDGIANARSFYVSRGTSPAGAYATPHRTGAAFSQLSSPAVLPRPAAPACDFFPNEGGPA